MAGAVDLRGNSKLIRWSGLAGMLGGLLLTVMFLLRAMFMQDPKRTVLRLTAGDLVRTAIVPLVLLLAGLLGVNARQAGRSGNLGRTGFIVAFIGSRQTTRETAAQPESAV